MGMGMGMMDCADGFLGGGRTTYQDPLGHERTWESAERPVREFFFFFFFFDSILLGWCFSSALYLSFNPLPLHSIPMLTLFLAQTRPQNSPIDGVGIVAIIALPTGPEIVLQKQFRPPIGKVVIEVPAGLVDAGESAAESAVRELREETGYVGVVTGESPVMFNGKRGDGFLEGWMGARLIHLVLMTDPGFCNTNLNLVYVTIDPSLPENREPTPQLEENEFIEVFTTPLKTLYRECKRLETEGYAIDARVGTLAEGIELARRWQI